MHKRIAFDINHPADVHTFKYLIKMLKKEGHQVLVTARHSQCSTELLVQNRIDFLIRPSGHGLLDRIRKIPKILRLLLNEYKIFKPDLLIGGPGNLYVAQLGRLLNIPCYILDDTEHTKIQNWLTFPFATKIWTPDCFYKSLGRKQVRFPGTKELAYLYPGRYQFDREKFLNLLTRQLQAEGKDWLLQELSERTKPVILLRVVAWDASHDQFRKRWINIANIIHQLRQVGILIISCGGYSIPEFEKHYLQISANAMHDLINFSDIIISEGATTAAEAAVLGKPTIYFNVFRLGYIEKYQKEYGLIQQAKNDDEVIYLTNKILSKPDETNSYQAAREKIFRKNTDITQWMFDYLKIHVLDTAHNSNSRKEICQVAKVDPNHAPIGGIENYVEQVSQKLIDHRYQVHLIGVDEIPENGKTPTVEAFPKKINKVHSFRHNIFTPILKNYRKDFATNGQFLRHLCLKGPGSPINSGSVIHFHRPDYVLPFLHLSNPKVCTIHGNPRKLIQFTKNRIILGTYLMLEKMLIPAFKKLIFVSHDAYETYSKLFPKLKNKMTVIPVGIPDYVHRHSEREIFQWRRKHGIRSHEKVLLFVGRLEKEKQVDKILDFFRNALKENRLLADTHFLIVGTGTMQEQLAKVVAPKTYSRIKFLNYIPNRELPMAFSSADATVLYSLSEGMPSVVLESLACGTPVLANPVGDLPYILQSGLNGYFFDDQKSFSENLYRILHESPRMTHYCIDSVKSYKMENVIGQLIEVYDEVWE